MPLGTLAPKEFATGSFGWHLSSRVQINVGDCEVWCMVNLQVTVAGSKDVPFDLPEEETPDGRRPEGDGVPDVREEV